VFVNAKVFQANLIASSKAAATLREWFLLNNVHTCFSVSVRNLTTGTHLILMNSTHEFVYSSNEKRKSM
jgi:hypothetical protein